MSDIHIQANRDLWNSWTTLHAESSQEHSALLTQLRTGQTTLNETDLREVGDVFGKSLLHLQCHFGLDTLSWAKEGAIVTGVDFSEEAITRARSLSKDLNLNARFMCSNIYDLPDSSSLGPGRCSLFETRRHVLHSGWPPNQAHTCAA
jgi:2-polyprenyl-3-methyl-5-hydroxy-6-metoxy-1,4-benzoquinol methylase